jgi:hypothetical protein
VRLVVATAGARLLGYARVAGGPPVAELAGLFVDPAAIGTGVGRLLLRHAIAIAAELGIVTLEIDSDPFAEPFYRHAGAVRAGDSPSTVDPPPPPPPPPLPHLTLTVPYATPDAHPTNPWPPPSGSAPTPPGRHGAPAGAAPAGAAPAGAAPAGAAPAGAGVGQDASCRSASRP